MDEHQLEMILKAIGRDEFAPPERLRLATVRRLRGARLLRVMVFLSLVLHWVAWGGALYALVSPDIPAVVKIYVVMGSVALAGTLAVVIVAARRQVARFLQRLECVVGPGGPGFESMLNRRR